jgi:PurA ssDNA and RNA-binding protein
MDTQLYRADLRIERKQFTFDLKENPRGTFLRITESGHDHYNAIVIPVTGLEEFRDALSEMVAFSQAPAGSRPILSLGQDTGKPSTDSSTDASVRS